MNEQAIQSRDAIDEWIDGFRTAQVLLTSSRLGLFSVIGPRSCGVDQIASRLGVSTRGIRILCDALAAMSILEKSGDRYRNGPLAHEYLLPDSPLSKVAALHLAARGYERWSRLDDAVATGRPVPETAVDPRLQAGKRQFAEAMADSAKRTAGLTADLLDLKGVRRLLDLGGGPGLYAIEFVRRYPELTAFVFDDPETLVVTKENVSREGLEGRVVPVPGDVFVDDLGDGFDFIFVSNLVHIYSYEQNARLVAKSAASLSPGGRLCIKDFVFAPDRQGPLWTALFAVNMLVSTESGDCYTAAEICAWFEAAGLTLGEELDVGIQSRLMIAARPPSGGSTSKTGR